MKIIPAFIVQMYEHYVKAKKDNPNRGFSVMVTTKDNMFFQLHSGEITMDILDQLDEISLDKINNRIDGMYSISINRM